ncbi:hypothetical protein HQ865_09945 [Mucilaginibacter mali]|uniref:Uncharacterized protein n=1 Tax=Mucilaginibacter mali TaxID=2740462 RepID=A0A7D4Q9D1_9SPHI|nr:hypothetical protein [Mucilaginibacter mali]QKJ30065.1 hypothetical protein HQ865_09945 [Mucilaginibacter mali]
METILKQRRFIVTKLFELTDRSLKVTVSTLTSSNAIEIDFENITTKISHQKGPKRIPTIFTGLSLAGLIICILSHFLEKNGSKTEDVLFYFVVFVACALITYLSYENELNLLLIHGTKLTFFANSPTKKTVEDFLSLIKKHQKEYLLNRYATADDLLSQEQLATNLRWLLERNIIDSEECEVLKQKLIIPKTEHVKTVGFTFGSN